MKKIIAGLLIGMIFTGALFLGPLSQNPALGHSDDSEQPETSADIPGIDREVLLSSLQKAGDEIQDDDIRQFYHILLQEYDLNGISVSAVLAAESTQAELLPDIYDVNHKAISVPLREAGKNISDEEIAQFYYKLLESAGWIVE